MWPSGLSTADANRSCHHQNDGIDDKFMMLLHKFIINAIVLHISTSNTASTWKHPTTHSHQHQPTPPAPRSLLSRLHNATLLNTVLRL